MDADFLRFYGIDLDEGEVEVDVIASRRFFSLALQLKAYEGALIFKVRQEQEEADKKRPSHLRDGEAEIIPDTALPFFATENEIEFK